MSTSTEGQPPQTSGYNRPSRQKTLKSARESADRLKSIDRKQEVSDWFGRLIPYFFFCCCCCCCFRVRSAADTNRFSSIDLRLENSNPEVESCRESESTGRFRRLWRFFCYRSADPHLMPEVGVEDTSNAYGGKTYLSAHKKWSGAKKDFVVHSYVRAYKDENGDVKKREILSADKNVIEVEES